MYKLLLRPLLFLFDPESIHHFTFGLLKNIFRIPGSKSIAKKYFSVKHPSLVRTLFGINFQNPIGLAAGFDKDARLINELSCLGFGFIEIGTVTPKPQPGNDKPRLFRLPDDGGLINRMGFNNKGAMAAAGRLKKRKSNVIVGGNIGKNKNTPNENAFDDYAICFEELYPYVDYFVVNVSSPNTPGLRELQEKEPLRKLLSQLKSHSLTKNNPRPILLKISPDLSDTQLNDVVEILQETKTDGVIATNTTIGRENLITEKIEVEKIGLGGLSGKPLAKRSTEVIRHLRLKLGEGYPIIGVGGIMSPGDAIEKINAGADLVQLYTGFVYEGPGFVNEICKALLGKDNRRNPSI
jgi:dihydroorotate dehydrogenase